jgi:hypothetical protein
MPDQTVEADIPADEPMPLEEKPAATASAGKPSEADKQEEVAQTSSPRDASMDDVKDGIKLPKKKRSRDQFNEDLEKDEDVAQESSKESRRVSEDTESASAAGNRASRTIRDEPEKKRHRDASQEARAEDSGTKPSVSLIIP